MKKINRFTTWNNQQGAVLIVGLIMLLLMTIVGLSAVKGSNLQEMMAGNLRDRNLAFQAAEAGLRVGEDAVNGINPPDTSGAVKGQVAEMLNGSNGSYWHVSHKWVDKDVITNSDSVATTVDLSVTKEAPRFVVEKLNVIEVMGQDGGSVNYDDLLKEQELSIYRITSRGVGLSSNTVVYLQSIYRRE